MKEANVVKYYVLCNKLKKLIRTGWKDWNVLAERLESVAEHIYGVQMLAIAMHSEYKYDIDLYKVILMIAIHELGETVIGDLTQFQITSEEKKKIERDAVHEILKDLIEGEMLENLFIEFDEKKTKEAFFAYQCDKLECDLQSKIYDEEAEIDLNNQNNNPSSNHPIVKRLLEEESSFSGMWIRFGQAMYPYDENFQSVSNYALNNKLTKK